MLSHLLNLCLKFGIVPSNFCDGVIVLILKKPNIDPSLPNNYRPITVSNIFSKIFELGFLDSSANVEFDSLQFGFVNGRGTAMAAATVNDVINYSVNQGSPVYSCSLMPRVHLMQFLMISFLKNWVITYLMNGGDVFIPGIIIFQSVLN